MFSRYSLDRAHRDLSTKIVFHVEEYILVNLFNFYEFVANFSHVFHSFSGFEGRCIGCFRSERCSLD